MKVSKATRAAAIEALLNVASQYERHPGSLALIADYAADPEWSLAFRAMRIVREANGWVRADADIYGAAASLLDAGWSPP